MIWYTRALNACWMCSRGLPVFLVFSWDWECGVWFFLFLLFLFFAFERDTFVLYKQTIVCRYVLLCRIVAARSIIYILVSVCIFEYFVELAQCWYKGYFSSYDYIIFYNIKFILEEKMRERGLGRFHASAGVEFKLNVNNMQLEG